MLNCTFLAVEYCVFDSVDARALTVQTSRTPQHRHRQWLNRKHKMAFAVQESRDLRFFIGHKLINRSHSHTHMQPLTVENFDDAVGFLFSSTPTPEGNYSERIPTFQIGRTNWTGQFENPWNWRRSPNSLDWTYFIQIVVWMLKNSLKILNLQDENALRIEMRIVFSFIDHGFKIIAAVCNFIHFVVKCITALWIPIAI